MSTYRDKTPILTVLIVSCRGYTLGTLGTHWEHGIPPTAYFQRFFIEILSVYSRG